MSRELYAKALLDDKWAVVTLFAGRHALLGPWMTRAGLFAKDQPAHTQWHWVVDPRQLAFVGFVEGWRALMPDRISVSMPNAAAVPTDVGDKLDVHRRVAALLNCELATVPEDTDWLLLWEDDVLARPEELKMMLAGWWDNAGTVAIGATYVSRHNRMAGRNPGLQSIVVGNLKGGSRQGNLRLEAVCDGKLHEAGLLGGGFTLYDLKAVRRCLPLTPGQHGGWDTDLSSKLIAHGGRLFIHGGAHAEHRYWLDGSRG